MNHIVGSAKKSPIRNTTVVLCDIEQFSDIYTDQASKNELNDFQCRRAYYSDGTKLETNTHTRERKE